MEVSVMMPSIYSGYVRVTINKLLGDWFTASHFVLESDRTEAMRSSG
jgi:hypothetical protein